MQTIRTIAKANLPLSIALLLVWLGYRLANGSPSGEQPLFHNRHGTGWVDLLLWQGILVYVFFIDRRIPEDFLRGFGFVCLLGVVTLLVTAVLQNQIDGSEGHVRESIFLWYQRVAFGICALIGRRPLTDSELARLRSVLSRLTSRDAGTLR